MTAPRLVRQFASARDTGQRLAELVPLGLVPAAGSPGASVFVDTGVRTLIRKLNAENTSYKAILTDLRRNFATELLRDARLTAAEVGMVLGYREPANFGRAFRRWYGESPAAWRRK